MQNPQLEPLRIGLVGGIFGAPDAYRQKVQFTPETVLLRGLTGRGHSVTPLTHYDAYDMDAFDVVHVHHLSWGAMYAATRWRATPFVFTLHQSRPAHPRFASFVMARADGVVALWPGDAEECRGRYDLAGADVRVIPNGIDAAVFHFEQPTPPAAGTPWRIHFAGQLIPSKGVDLLLHAMAELRTRHRIELELSYHANPEEAALRALAAQLGIDDIVHFLGAAPQVELSRRLRGSHIVVLPSRRTLQGEALPSALSEAMLCGRYAVSSDVGGIRDQLGSFGVVMPEASADAVAKAIETAIADYDNHCARAMDLRREAVRRFSIEQMIDGHESMYRSVLERRAVPRRRRAAKVAGTLTARVALDTRMVAVRARRARSER